jgi:N-succinyldiaminopimelate aminotransferase
MNPLLSRLQPYPFERLRELFVGITPDPAHPPISLGIGEPKHPTPEFIKERWSGGLPGHCRPAGAARCLSQVLMTRYGLNVDANRQMLPVNGTREALFAFAQTMIDAVHALSACPCPMKLVDVEPNA